MKGAREVVRIDWRILDRRLCTWWVCSREKEKNCTCYETKKDKKQRPGDGAALASTEQEEWIMWDAMDSVHFVYTSLRYITYYDFLVMPKQEHGASPMPPECIGDARDITKDFRVRSRNHSTSS